VLEVHAPAGQDVSERCCRGLQTAAAGYELISI